MGKYDDILNYKYPNPEIERDFKDKVLREAQFAPFAALSGYEEAIEEAARLTENKIELDEYEKEEIDAKLRYIASCTAGEVSVGVVYFLADDKKAGGRYVEKRGKVGRIDEFESALVFSDGTTVKVDDICDIVIEANKD